MRKKIVTELAVLDVTENGFKLIERAPGVSVEEIKNKTAGKLIVEGDVPEMQFAFKKIKGVNLLNYFLPQRTLIPPCSCFQNVPSNDL